MESFAARFKAWQKLWKYNDLIFYLFYLIHKQLFPLLAITAGSSLNSFLSILVGMINKLWKIFGGGQVSSASPNWTTSLLTEVIQDFSSLPRQYRKNALNILATKKN